MVSYIKTSASGKYKDCYHVLNVPGRTGILIHKGNLPRDTKGCLLPGIRLGSIMGQRAVTGSAGGMRRLHNITNKKGFILNVRDIT